MKTLYTNCFLPLSGARSFAVENGRFAPAEPPFEERRDLHGAFVLPAFLDAHSHLLAYALTLLQADGAACRTAEEYAACADAFARSRALPDDALVTIKHADVFPDAAALDAFPRPLHLQARSGHAGMFNLAARRMARGARAGVMEEGEYLAAARRLPLPQGIGPAFEAAQRDYLSHGYCLAQEGALTREMFPLYADLLPALRMDTIAYAPPQDYDEAVLRFPAGCGRLRIGGVKIFLDGSPQQRTAFLRAPYTGGGRGMSEMTAQEIDEACAFCAARGAQLLAHCNGDGAAEQFLGAVERLPPPARRRIRPVLIHGQIVGVDQLCRAAHLGVTISFFPAHIRYWGETHLRNLGAARAMRISPARTAIARGVLVTLHQDTPVCRPDPLEAAACAVTRRTAGGALFAGEEISPREALLCLTENVARQYGKSDMGGTQCGMRAHFALFARDPAASPAGLEQDVEALYLDGAPVFSRTP